jgi:cytoskeletal protein CcmA (bactofilin family)
MSIFGDRKDQAQSPAAQGARTGASVPESSASRQTVLGAGIQFDGTVSGEGEIVVGGNLKGEVNLQGSLTIAPKGTVQAEVKARRVVVEGTVKGNVTASERVDLRATGVVEGDITTPRISVAEGAALRGRVTMTNQAAVSESGARAAKA